MPTGVYIRTEEHRKRMSKARKGIRNSPATEFKKGHKTHSPPSVWFKKGNKINLGRHQSEETKKKRVASRAGYRHSEETKRKIGLANKGNVSWAKGRTFSEEHRKKIGDALRGKYVGSKGANWRGGTSFLPYSPEFNVVLKRFIRERDKCCLYPDCGTTNKLSVHHIDYDKMNDDRVNLITLCMSHNVKVNSNRKYWEAYFNEITQP